MSSGNGSQTPYSFSISQAHRAQLRQLHLEQDELGRGHRFIAALRDIIRRLRRDPHVFGEELYTLPNLKLQIRQSAIYPLVVDYGVHEEKKLVFILGFKGLG